MIKTIKKVAVIIMTVVIMISTVTIADQASSTTVQAASGYSGKIYKHWCKLRTAKSKRSKTIKKLSVGTKVTVLSTRILRETSPFRVEACAENRCFFAVSDPETTIGQCCSRSRKSHTLSRG